jgi:hypothetical protein
MKSNVPRFWTPRTGGLLTLVGLAVVTVVATLLGESLIGRGTPSPIAVPGPKLTVAPIFKGLQAEQSSTMATYAVKHGVLVARRHHANHAVAVAPAAVTHLAPVIASAPVLAAVPVVAAPVVVAQRPMPVVAAPIPPELTPLTAAAVHKRHHAKRPAAVAEAPTRAPDPQNAWPTPRPLPPRALVPVTTMTAPPPASSQLRPVVTVTAAPPTIAPSVPAAPAETVTAAPPRT